MSSGVTARISFVGYAARTAASPSGSACQSSSIGMGSPLSGMFTVFHALISPRKRSGSPVSVSSSKKSAQIKLTH